METLTFLFTDIQESTKLLRRIGGEEYAEVLVRHHHVIRTSLVDYGGLEQGTQGDSFFAVFTSPSACVSAAIAMQRRLESAEWPDGARPLVRMGIHTGEASERSTGLVGYEVHRAARIAGVGYGGQILLSSAAAGLVEDVLAPGVGLRDLGSHRLKDLGRPETIFQLVVDGLESNFPPLRSLDNPELANNLPESLTPFIGRSAELAEVRELVNASRLITLTGAGGSGKTRLGLQVAAELLDGSGEGVWFVDLAPVSDADQVPAVVISTLQLRHQPEMSALDSLTATLRGQHILIMLDNCEHVIDAVAKMADVIARSCPRVILMATSREPLGVDGERIYRVRSLTLPGDEVESVDDLAGSDAIELFVARTRAHDSTFQLDDAAAPLVASICRRLDGIPLAIELAASRLSSMSLKDLHERLDQRFRLLTGGSRNALPRQQTLGAMVAWSYDLLSEPEREALRRLSVFVGGFDLRAAEAVCATGSLEVFDVADLLSSLVNKSLVGAERTSTDLRYRLLETIRQYSAEQLLQVDGESEALLSRRRHAAYFLDLCESAAPELIGPNQALWLRRLDVEWDNVLAAFTLFSSEDRGAEKVLRLGVALHHFFTTRVNSTMIPLMLQSLERDDVPAKLRANALSVVAHIILMTDFGERPDAAARELLRVALDLSEQLGDLIVEFEVRLWMVLAAAALGLDDERRECAERATQLARSSGDPRHIGQALILGTYGEWDGHQFGHSALHTEALALLREAGDLQYVCTALIFLSISGGFERGDLPYARAIFEEAMAIAEELGSVWHSRLLWTNYGLVLYLLGEVDEAEQFSRRSLLTSRRIGAQPAITSWIVFTMACCATSRGDVVRGAHLIGAHDALFESLSVSNRGSWSAMEVEMREKCRESLREALGDSEYDRCLALGRGLSLDRIVDYALRRVTL
ncbi:MAG TPA: adenylate/guanylate cyclase domain-containing protein [Acidimicrobiales bacterium]|nr:adenylate/guanylate cyclase domain-containing protein [Acidimicrobiales bacterium]